MQIAKHVWVWEQVQVVSSCCEVATGFCGVVRGKCQDIEERIETCSIDCWKIWNKLNLICSLHCNTSDSKMISEEEMYRLVNKFCWVCERKKLWMNVGYNTFRFSTCDNVGWMNVRIGDKVMEEGDSCIGSLMGCQLYGLRRMLQTNGRWLMPWKSDGVSNTGIEKDAVQRTSEEE